MLAQKWESDMSAMTETTNNFFVKFETLLNYFKDDLSSSSYSPFKNAVFSDTHAYS